MPSDSDTSPVVADSATQRLRQIHRAASELRRGVPLVVEHERAAPLVVLAAEIASPGAIEELTELGAGEPLLLLAPVRAAAVMAQPIDERVPAVSIALPPPQVTQDSLRAYADPTVPPPSPARRKVLRVGPTPEAAPAALGLAKIAQLLPAVLAVSARP